MGWKDSFQASGKTGSAQPEAVLNAEGGWKKSFQQDSVRRGDLAASSQMAEEARQKQENQQKGFFQNLGEGLTLGAKQRVLGLAQASNDLLGWASPETAQDMNGLARNYQARGRGTGTGGLIGEILGDPLTAATLPIAGTGSVGGLALQGAGIGAAGGATAPMENSNLPDRLTGMGLSAAIGGVGGAAIPVAGKVVRKAAKPFTAVDGELGRLAGVMEQEGVALTPAQKTGSKVLRGVETGFAELPFTSGAQAKVTDAQQKAFNAAVLKRAGIAADSATPDVLDAGKRAISKQFEDIAARTTLNVDDALLNRLAAVEKEAAKRLGKDEARAVQSFIDDVLSSGGKIDGRTYQNTRSMLGQMAQGGKDSFKSGLLKDMQSALDDAAFRSLSPADQAAWLQARTQYGAYKTIEKAMSSTGNNTLAGNISPAALASAAKTANKNYATGAGALNDLARGGAAFLRDPVGNSGTGQRLLWQGLLSGTGVAGYATGGVPGAVASMAAPKGLQAIYNTGPVQRYLTQAAGKAAPAVGPLSKAAAAAAALGGAAAAEEQASPGEPLRMTVRPSDAAPLPPVDLPGGAQPAPQQQAPVVESPGPQSSLPPDLLQRIAQAESSGNPNARSATSSASGLYQFTDDTWARSVAKWGKELGVGPKDKNRPEAQEAVMGKLLADNARILKKGIGRDPTEGELYVAHFLGAEDAKRLIGAQGSGRQAVLLFPRRVVSANRSIFFDPKGNRPRTVEEVYSLLTNKVNA